MKRIFVLAALTAVCQFGFSQENTAPENNSKQEAGVEKMRRHKGKHHHRKMMVDLNLSEDQKAKMKEMRMANKEKKDAILNNSSLSEPQKKEQLKDLHKTQADHFKSLLTDDQKNKMKTMKKDRKHGRRIKDGKLKKPEKAEKVIESTNQ